MWYVITYNIGIGTYINDIYILTDYSNFKSLYIVIWLYSAIQGRIYLMECLRLFDNFKHVPNQ